MESIRVILRAGKTFMSARPSRQKMLKATVSAAAALTSDAAHYSRRVSILTSCLPLIVPHKLRRAENTCRRKASLAEADNSKSLLPGRVRGASLAEVLGGVELRLPQLLRLDFCISAICREHFEAWVLFGARAPGM